MSKILGGNVRWKVQNFAIINLVPIEDHVSIVSEFVGIIHCIWIPNSSLPYLISCPIQSLSQNLEKIYTMGEATGSHFPVIYKYICCMISQVIFCLENLHIL